MDTIAYRIVLRADGWHAEPNGNVPDVPERVFQTRDEAQRWCRSLGFIPEGEAPRFDEDAERDEG
ncbi:MAG TPA: hypothetical protein VEL07_16685 [Planctomycetota bacterium]|nr:hypothetical protein [Planctomycetota bacterium]